jgi:serine/threonine protein kinase
MKTTSQLKSSKKIGDYLLIKKLGEGTTAKVFLAKHEKTGELIAMKRIQIQLIARHKSNRANLKSELYIMNKINHPNVMHCKEFYESDHHYYILMEYCNKGTLEFLRSAKRKQISERECMGYMRQIMQGFKVLRAYKVIHRDIKLENLLLHDDVLKISDFGVAKFGKDHAKTKLVGTVLSMAPELMSVYEENELDENYCSKVDLWSIGIVYYEILFGECPFYGAYIGEMIANMKRGSGENLRFPKKVSPEIEDLIRKLLIFDPKDRIEWEEFFVHPAFSLYPLDPKLQELYATYDEKQKKKKTLQKKKNNSSQDNFGVFKRRQTMKMDANNASRFDKTINSIGTTDKNSLLTLNGSKKMNLHTNSSKPDTPSKVSTIHNSNGQSGVNVPVRKKVQLQASLSNKKIKRSERDLRSKFNTIRSILDKSDGDHRSEKKSRGHSRRKGSNMSSYIENSFGKLIKSKSRSRLNRSKSKGTSSVIRQRINSIKKSNMPMKDSKTSSTSGLSGLGSTANSKRIYRNRSNNFNDSRSRSRKLNRSKKNIGSSSNLKEYEYIFRESNIKNNSRTAKMQKEQLRIQEDHRIDFNVRLVNNRYIHEKNKVMFINLSIKKIRELIKMNIYPDIEYNFYLTVIFLMRKAMVLADLTLESLKLKENIFEFEFFDHFINSQYYKSIVREYESDIPNFRKYFNYLVEWARSKGLPYFDELNKHIRQMKDKGGMSLGQLDKQLREQLGVLCSFEIEEFAPRFVNASQTMKGRSESEKNKLSREVNESVFEIKKDFYQVLVKLKYSIYCERYFPYKLNESFFDWKDFFEKIKGISLERMKKIIDKIR